MKIIGDIVIDHKNNKPAVILRNVIFQSIWTIEDIENLITAENINIHSKETFIAELQQKLPGIINEAIVDICKQHTEHLAEKYQSYLKRIDEIFDSEPGTPEGEELEKLVSWVEEYEKNLMPELRYDKQKLL